MMDHKKTEQEQDLLAEMIRMYCRKKHHGRSLCEDCRALTVYAQQRNSHCPNRRTKTSCSRCQTPCYKPEMREKIRSVMRYSGPRILFRHPLSAIRHALNIRR